MDLLLILGVPMVVWVVVMAFKLPKAIEAQRVANAGHAKAHAHAISDR